MYRRSTSCTRFSLPRKIRQRRALKILEIPRSKSVEDTKLSTNKQHSLRAGSAWGRLSWSNYGTRQAWGEGRRASLGGGLHQSGLSRWVYKYKFEIIIINDTNIQGLLLRLLLIEWSQLLLRGLLQKNIFLKKELSFFFFLFLSFYFFLFFPAPSAPPPPPTLDPSVI